MATCKIACSFSCLLYTSLENKSIRKVVAEAKEVELCLAAFNIKVVNIIDDVSLAAYLLQPERGHYDLLHLAQSYLHKEIACMDEAQQAAIMAQQLFPLREELKKSLEETKMLSIYYDMEDVYKRQRQLQPEYRQKHVVRLANVQNFE